MICFQFILLRYLSIHVAFFCLSNHLYVWFYDFCLSRCLLVNSFVCPVSDFYLSVCLSICLCVHFQISICSAICLSICLCPALDFYLSSYLPICLVSFMNYVLLCSFTASLCLDICLLICQYVQFLHSVSLQILTPCHPKLLQLDVTRGYNPSK